MTTSMSSTFVGQHIGSALSRAGPIEETRQRNAELTLVNEIGQALAQPAGVRGDHRARRRADPCPLRNRSRCSSPGTTRRPGRSASRTSIEEGQRTSTTASISLGLGPDVDRHPRAAAAAAGSRPQKPEALGAITFGNATESWLGVPILHRRYRHRGHRAGGHRARRPSTRAPSGSSARSPRAWPSRSRTRALFDETQAAVRRDRRARRRAGHRQRRPAGSRRRARHAVDVRAGGRQAPGDLRRAGRRHRDLRLRGRGHALPVRHRARGPVPRRARADSPMATREYIASRAPEVIHDVPAWERRARGDPLVIQGEPSLSIVRVPMMVGWRGARRHLAPEPRPYGRLQRGRRPPADDPRRQPERRARERPADRPRPAGSSPRRTSARPSWPSSTASRTGLAPTARHPGDVRPRRRHRASRSSTPRSSTSGSSTVTPT